VLIRGIGCAAGAASSDPAIAFAAEYPVFSQASDRMTTVPVPVG
jgi:hypothetical protein